jgi:hypothetical protein
VVAGFQPAFHRLEACHHHSLRASYNIQDAKKVEEESLFLFLPLGVLAGAGAGALWAAWAVLGDLKGA